MSPVSAENGSVLVFAVPGRGKNGTTIRGPWEHFALATRGNPATRLTIAFSGDQVYVIGRWKIENAEWRSRPFGRRLAAFCRSMSLNHNSIPPVGRPPFALYDNRADLGNQGPPDGANFKGRGFVQLTGRANYTQFSNVIGLGDQLVQDPDLDNDPNIAAKLLAAFLGAEANRIRQALQNNDLATARRLVNGGTHGLANFEDAFQRGQGLIPDPV